MNFCSRWTSSRSRASPAVAGDRGSPLRSIGQAALQPRQVDGAVQRPGQVGGRDQFADDWLVEASVLVEEAEDQAGGAGVREEYLSRVSYANTNFRVLGRDGFKTDRGRVMILYGQPDDVDRHPNETEMRPYEVWSYNNIQGGVIFVFVLRNAAGDYELVHTLEGTGVHNGRHEA